PGARRGNRCARYRAHGVGSGKGCAVAVAPGVDEDPAATIGLAELLREMFRIALHEDCAHPVSELRDLVKAGLTVKRNDNVVPLRARRLDPAWETELSQQLADPDGRGAQNDGVVL